MFSKSGILIFMFAENNYSIYTHIMLIKTPLLHQSLGPRVFLSFCLSLSLSLYFWLIFWNVKASCVTQEILASLLFYFLIVDSRPPGSGPLKDLNNVQLFVTPRTVACQAPLSMGFSRQEYYSGLPFPSPNLKNEKKKNRAEGKEVPSRKTISAQKYSE